MINSYIISQSFLHFLTNTNPYGHSQKNMFIFSIWQLLVHVEQSPTMSIILCKNLEIFRKFWILCFNSWLSLTKSSFALIWLDFFFVSHVFNLEAQCSIKIKSSCGYFMQQCSLNRADHNFKYYGKILYICIFLFFLLVTSY